MRSGSIAAVTFAVVSLIAGALLMRAAVASGFGILGGPIVAAELLFLGAVYLIWRGLDLGEDAPKGPRAPRV